MPRGKYIVIEGNDGTGKSTQAELLVEWLKAKDISVVETHEPGGTPLSAELRRIIKNGELERDAYTNLLLFTAARHELWREIENNLLKGDWVVSARNYFSTLAYQGYGEGLDKKLIVNTTESFVSPSYMHPDVSVILTLNNIARQGRIGSREGNTLKDTFESKNADFQDRVNIGYEQIAQEMKITLIDASERIDTIQKHIRQLVGKTID